MNIFITTTNNIDSYMESNIFKEFTRQCNEYRDRVEKRFLNSLKNDTQKKIFMDWCNGVCVSSEKYLKENNISEEDNYIANNAILSVVSLGFG